MSNLGWFDRLVVEIRPDPAVYPGPGSGWRELVVTVRVGGRDFSVRQPFRAAFFESVFRLLLDRAACEIERLVREGPAGAGRPTQAAEPKPPDCTCGFPEVVCRNVCGHDFDCPVYERWVKGLP